MSKGNIFCDCVNDDIEDFEEQLNLKSPKGVYCVDFQKTSINTTHFKTISVVVPDSITKETDYNICRHAKINPIYQVFNLNKYNGRAKPGKPIEIKIKFQPNIPFQDFLEKFMIWLNSETLLLIKCSGYCIAPIVEPDITDLYFFKTGSSPAKHVTITLTNKSSAPATYEFEIDEEQDIFLIQKENIGKIEGRCSEKIYFKFKPSKVGMYSIQIFCLICYHEPLVFNLFGIYSETDYGSDKYTYRRYSLPKLELSGYQAYFSNIVDVKQYIPPVSLNTAYINFGSVWSEDNTRNVAAQAFSLTNHKSNGIRVEWLIDSKVFSINPTIVSVPPKESITFECRFKPISPNHLYARILRAQIFWKYDEEPKLISIPINECIRVIGHSFIQNQMIAKTNIEPSIITLPPCLPYQIVDTTFMIENIGPVPVIYKFIPPKNTNIILKPMIGIIVHKKLVAVQFKTNLNEKKTYIEQWMMVLNENCEKYMPIYLRVECAIPNVTVGNNDSVNFGSIQTETQINTKVDITNNTIYKLRFEFEMNNSSFFKVSPSSNILYPYDQVSQIMTFTALYCSKSRFKETVKFKVIQSEDSNNDDNYYHEFKVYGNHKLSQLFAEPNYIITEPLSVGTGLSVKFNIINWGDTPVIYSLYISENKLSSNTDSHPYVFNIIPEKGMIRPQEKTEINMNAVGVAVGKSLVKVSYFNRISEHSDVPANLDPVEIFELSSELIFPSIRFDEIVEHNYGQFFTKKHLWEMLKIEEINKTMSKLKEDEMESVDIILPAMPQSDQEYYAVILVNILVQSGENDIKIYRHKNCDCKLEQVKSRTFRKTQYNCPHRLMFDIKWVKVSKNEKNYILCTYLMKYNLEGYNVLSFIFDMSGGHKILLNFHLQTTPYKEFYIFSYTRTYDFYLHDIYIGEKDSVIQCFWLYNNTNESVNYAFDIQQLEDMNNNEGFEVLHFINSFGTIESFTRHSLMVKFQPIEVAEYKVILNGLIGDENVTLIIIGKGINKPCIKQNLLNITMPQSNSIEPSRLPIYFSKDYTDMQILSSCDSIEFIVFLINSSDELVFYYEFEKIYMDQIIKIEATENAVGYIKPGHSQNIKITISSLLKPLSSEVILNCKVLNVCEEHVFDMAYKEKKEEKLNADMDQRDAFLDFKINPPTEQYINTYISIYIVSSSDKDLYISPHLQIQRLIYPSIFINPDNIVDSGNKIKKLKSESLINTVSQEYEEYIRHTIECLIGNVIFSKKFKYIMNRSINNRSVLYDAYMSSDYWQDLTSEEIKKMRKKDTIRLFNGLPLKQISRIVKNILKKTFEINCALTNTSTLEDCQSSIQNYIENSKNPKPNPS